jgi:adenosylcobinamide kinase/adenosylcobinamide-phosphate guanylyltransferase
MALALILGGARSGKSDLAVRLAASSGRPVLFVATMEPGDDELRARVAAHRASRPAEWRTIEAPVALLDALTAEACPDAFVIIDCVTLWVSNLLLAALGDAERATAGEIDAAVRSAVTLAEKLAAWCADAGAEVAAVSNEVGSGVVPAYALGRAFRDSLGGANRALASRASRVYWTTAGLVLELKSLGAVPVEAFGEEPPGSVPA